MRKKANLRSRILLIWIFVLIGLTVGVLAYPYWTPGTPQSTSYWNENNSIGFTYNFSVNVSNQSDSSSALIYTFGAGTNISSSLYGFKSPSFFYWINLDSSSGILTINSSSDNETGKFNTTIDVYYDSGTKSIGAQPFYFIINATNDEPVFNLENNYTFRTHIDENVSENIMLIGSDEEEHYPLDYNVSFNSCEPATWNTRGNCELDYIFYEINNTTSKLELQNLSYYDVGDYNLTICVMDNTSFSSLPTYRDSDYENVQYNCQNTTIHLTSSLSIDASDCDDGRIWLDNETLSCVINITTINREDSVDFSALGYFKYDSGPGGSRENWFYSPSELIATNWTISIPINIELNKTHVGNWWINLTADDSIEGEMPRPVVEQISVFVNYTESSVNFTSTFNDLSLFENYNFSIVAADDDLLIWDDSIKNETLTFDSNESSWITFSSNIRGGEDNFNYRSVMARINHTYALDTFNETNRSVNFTVTDLAGNLDWEVIVIEILNDTAPEWNLGLDNLVVFNLTEDEVGFEYNVSMNVSDAENDSISFYYVNDSEFCSFNSSNFNSSSGIISFVPTDCDVGFHNVSVIASDGKRNSAERVFGFNISNVNDVPEISGLLGYYEATEDVVKDDINWGVNDDDFLVLQKDYYNESLNVSLVFINVSSDEVVSGFFNFNEDELSDYTQNFKANFTPRQEDIGVYNITVNVTDTSGASVVDYFILNVTSVNNEPNLTNVVNLENTTKIDFLYYDFDANDSEDGNDTQENLFFALYNISGRDILTINSTTGEINVTMSEELAGFYEYNISVTDSGTGGIENKTDWQLFNLTVYGMPNITLPSENSIFNFTENIQNFTEFEVDYMINDTNLTYEFYIDRVVYSDAENFSYTNLTLRDSETWIWNSSENFSWDFTPDYSDETYGYLKNMTLLVYNTKYPELNASVSYKLDITHTNEEISSILNFSDYQIVVNTVSSDIPLSDYFSDVDAFDEYYINESVNFTIETDEGYTHGVEDGTNPRFGDWIMRLFSSQITTTPENIRVVAEEYHDGVLFKRVASDWFEVEVVASGGGGTTSSGTSTTRTTTELKHFSLKLVMPQDIILKDNNYIEVPFSLQNTGAVVLNGINLDSLVRYNNQFSDDVKVVLQDTFVPTLAVGEIQNYTLRITANTQRSGNYKVTVNANVTSPKFSDWGEFFIKLEKTNESEAEQLLLFTEKFIAENAECLELMEVVDRAGQAFAAGEIDVALDLINEATIACEDAILANEQIRYSAKNFVERNFYLIAFVFLGLFIVGLGFYIYKRVRFNKYKGDYY